MTSSYPYVQGEGLLLDTYSLHHTCKCCVDEKLAETCSFNKRSIL